MSKGKSTVVIHVADDIEDDLFEEALEPPPVMSDPTVVEANKGEANVPSDTGDNGDSSDGKGQSGHLPIDQQALMVSKMTSTPDAGCSNSAHTSFTLSGAFCESLAPLTSAQLRTLPDEQMVAAVPLFSQVDETFREVVRSLPMARPYFFLPLSFLIPNFRAFRI